MPWAKVIFIKGKLAELKLINMELLLGRCLFKKAMIYSLGENIYRH